MPASGRVEKSTLGVSKGTGQGGQCPVSDEALEEIVATEERVLWRQRVPHQNRQVVLTAPDHRLPAWWLHWAYSQRKVDYWGSFSPEESNRGTSSKVKVAPVAFCLSPATPASTGISFGQIQRRATVRQDQRPNILKTRRATQ